MPRRACAIVLPNLPLQLLWRKRPEWRNDPVAIVADETPEAPILMLSRKAYARGLRPGIRQGAARNMVLDLRTAVIRDDEVEALCVDIARSLQTFSPRVERENESRNSSSLSTTSTAAFFIDPSGLDLLYGGTHIWARTVERYLKGRGLRSSLVVGFERFSCLAIAHQPKLRSPFLVESPEAESALAGVTNLRTLGLSEKLCDPLSMLGIETLGEFLAVPPGELRTRFGKDASEIHARFANKQQLPLQPIGFEAPRRIAIEVMPPSQDRQRLLFTLKSALDPLLSEVEGKGERMAALHIELGLELYGRRRLTEEERFVSVRLEPATPTINARSLLELIRLRLSGLEILAPVESIALEAEVVFAQGEQLLSPNERPKRDPKAAAEALARVAASFGERSVCRAVLRDAHLPEAQYVWAPFSKAHDAFRSSAEEARTQSLEPPLHKQPLHAQRRLLPQPEPLSSSGKGGGFAWPEPIVRLHGPHRSNGGWWGKETSGAPSIDRDYYYAETESGEMLWVFFDRKRHRWHLHGRVE
ncbi:MAG: hypothetical protein AB8H86_03515 [Polyangiales bacterium]